MKKHTYFPLFLALQLSIITSSDATDEKEWIDEDPKASFTTNLIKPILTAKKTFPDKDTHYTLKEFLTAFKPIILRKDLWGIFEENWTLIYTSYENAKKTTKRLGIKKETSHIRCHYTTLLGYKNAVDMSLEEKIDYQKDLISNMFDIKAHKALM